MTPPRRRVLFLALDAGDPELIRRRRAEGDLPVLARILERGRAVTLRSCAEYSTSSVWPSIATGTRAGRHGVIAYRQLRPGTLELRSRAEVAEASEPATFWEGAAVAGLAACVIDIPEVRRHARVPGVTRVVWGEHAPIFEPSFDPFALHAEIRHRFGPHPARDDNPYLVSVQDLARARRRLERGAALRGRVLALLLGRRPWDLFAAGVSELHVGGHQFANLEDREHPCHDARAARALGGSPLRAVYRAVDRALGDFFDIVGPEWTVLCCLSHPIRPTYGGAELVPAVLERLGLLVRDASPGAGARAHGLARRARAALEAIVPAGIQVRIARAIPEVQRVREAGARMRAGVDWARTKAFSPPSFVSGFVRLHLRGREPGGTVAPGAEADALLERIEAELRALRVAGTGAPAVRDILRPARAWPGPRANDLPDLIVSWHTERPIPAVESPSLGRIENADPGRRPGHAGRGSLVAWGPGIRAPGADGGADAGEADVADIAPTILALLGVAPPPDLDGGPIASLIDGTPGPS